MARYSGRCACGAVHFETDAEPMMAGHCQCSRCQKLSGAPHSSFAAFPEAAVRMSGKLASWSYTADSGNVATRHHCPTCGAPVYGTTKGMPGVMAITLSMLDDPAAIVPKMAFFTKHAVPWDLLDDSLVAFPGMPPM
ncbi:MAG: GFA family protein [Rhizobiales bacterium]|nr:GFA family protein [Hyphomicrobiales bacterium]MBI3673248.1 GFA family protein [Hyphomicrobiales bacterium]